MSPENTLRYLYILRFSRLRLLLMMILLLLLLPTPPPPPLPPKSRCG